MTTFRFSGEWFRSQAFRCWRVDATELNMNGQVVREGNLKVEKFDDAEQIRTLFPAVKNFSDFELLISTVRDRVKPTGFWSAYVS